ncbi:MAG: hypothetical protein WC028_09225 [Candidatus Obscuribacterales bacterium]|jgi:hypothetical protein
MSLFRESYEIVIARVLSLVRFQKSEDAPLKAPSIDRLGTVERLRQSRFARTESVSNQGAFPAPSNSRPLPCHQSAAALPAPDSEKGKGSGIVCGVNSVAAIAQEKEKDNAARRARVTSTRLTALKNYLEQGAN